MPSIKVITPKLKKGDSARLAKALQEAAYPVIKNREIYTFILEPDYYVNGEEKEGDFITLEVSGPILSEEDRGKLCKALYEASKGILGERRTIFSYSSTPLEYIGVNGLLLPEYRKAKEKKA